MLSLRATLIALFLGITFTLDGVSAHDFELHNKCSYSVPLLVSNWANTPYTGPQPNTLQPGQKLKVTMPTGWNGRICHNTAGCGNNCYGGCSMTEFNLDTPGQYGGNFYDVSNIQGFTVPQAIVPFDKTCDSLHCTSATCPCNQAYPIGNESGCGDDLPVRNCATSGEGFSVIYCP